MRNIINILTMPYFWIGFISLIFQYPIYKIISKKTKIKFFFRFNLSSFLSCLSFYLLWFLGFTIWYIQQDNSPMPVSEYGFAYGMAIIVPLMLIPWVWIFYTVLTNVVILIYRKYKKIRANKKPLG